MSDWTGQSLVYKCAKCGAAVIQPTWIQGNPVCWPCTKNEPPTITYETTHAKTESEKGDE